MPVGNEAGSDAATFSNMDPNTSDANALGGGSTQVIWGTNISMSDTMHAVKDFFMHFQKKYRLMKDGTQSENQPLPADNPGNEKEYVEMMKVMLELGVTALNLDARNLKAYPPTRKLWHQLQAFPNEIVPIIDVVIKDIMIELAEKRMNELRVQQANSRMRDSSSLPPMPSSEAGNQNGAEAGGASNVPDLVRDVESKIYRVRPFGLDNTINLRELNPSGRWLCASIFTRRLTDWQTWTSSSV